MRYLFAFLFLITTVAVNAQTPVQGTFTYRATITYPDTTAIYREWKVKAYTNDTIVRVETEGGQFGTQVYIRHMELNKAYLLLNIEGQKFAIQTDLNKTPDSVKTAYTFKKMFGSKKIDGIKCKKYKVIDAGQKDGYICYFAKKYSNKYLEVYKDIPGLAIDYYLPSNDGLIHYQLESFLPGAVNRDLFGVPSDYKKVTFDEFVNMFMGEGGEEE